jgi:hypothetical protein
MATNRDLLAEAIADAKTVKETAIANAKAALEEAFTPHLTQMLSMKLQEMEDTIEEDAEYDATEAEDQGSMDEVSLEELLAELEEGENTDLNEAKDEEEETEEESEEMSIEDMDEDDLKSFIEDVIKDMVSAGELEAGHEGMENEEGAEELEAEETEDEESEESEVEGEEDEIVDIEELLNEEETIEEEISLDELLAELEGMNEEETESLDEKVEDEEMKKELEEAMATIAILKKDLNEINLLNAKLLYTNKIFRSKSLTESQKVKVLTAFDKATSKKEVELVYETLNEGLKVSTISTKSPIKESLGSASRALGNATSKPIIENDAFSRMRELAGLKK